MSEVTRDEFDRLQRQVEKNTERLASGDADLAVIKTELREIDTGKTYHFDADGAAGSEWIEWTTGGGE